MRFREQRLNAVAAVVKLLAQRGAKAPDAKMIVDYLQATGAAAEAQPDAYTLNQVQRMLGQLKPHGHYDRLIAEGRIARTLNSARAKRAARKS